MSAEGYSFGSALPEMSVRPRTDAAANPVEVEFTGSLPRVARSKRRPCGDRSGNFHFGLSFVPG
jgi:hypothetical protein